MTTDEGHHYPPEQYCKCHHTDAYHRDGKCRWIDRWNAKCKCTSFYPWDSLADSQLDLMLVLLPREYVEWRASKSGRSLSPTLFSAVVRKCQEALDGRP